jgi:hypothetical protein
MSIYDIKKDYPAPVITKADNHPVYVNGTKLINGHPVIDDNHKDISRVEEFQKLGFNPDYIRWLTDDLYPRAQKGSPINYGSSLPYKPAYGKIKNETKLSDPDKYDLIHKIEITDNQVIFNGARIATAPEIHGNGKKVTKTEKLTFCRAVVYSIIPGEIKRNVKNKHGNMEIMSVPDDEYFRELIAKYPALISNQSEEMQKIMSDESPAINLDHIVEDIVLSPYPGPGIIDEYRYHGPCMELEMSAGDLSKTLEELTDMIRDEEYNMLSLESENNRESPEEIINAFCKIPAGTYYPHLKVYIQEVTA